MAKENIYKIKEKVSLNFGHLQNAQNVAIALCMSGYYVKIRIEGAGTYVLEIYTDRI